MPEPAHTGPVNVVLPAGGTVSVDPEAARVLVQQGGRLETGLEGDAAAQTAAEAKRYDNPVAAAGLGAFRTLTAGGSDVAARALGYDYEVGKLKEHNPVGSLVGELGTALLPVGAPGIIAKAAKAAGNAVRGASAGSKIAGAVVETAVDGGVWNAAQQVSNSALTGDRLTGEKLALSIGSGALWGGAVGGGLGGVAVASGAIRKKLAGKANPLLDVRSQGAKELGQHIGHSIKEAEDGVDDVINRARDKRAGEILQQRDQQVGGFATSPEDYAGAMSGAPQKPGRVIAAEVAEAGTVAGKGKKPAPVPDAALDDTVATRPASKAPTQPTPESLWPAPKPNESAVAYAIRAADSEFAAVRDSLKAARQGVVKRFGDDMAIDLASLARKPAAQAFKSIQAIDDYVGAIQKVKALGGDELVDAQKLIIGRIQQKATGSVVEAFNGLANMDRTGIADVLKVDVDRLPQFGPVAEHVLKAYSVARFADDITAKAAVGAAEAKLAAVETQKAGGFFGGSKLKMAAQAASLLSMGRPVHTLMRLATMAGKVSGQLAEGVDKFVQVAASGTARRAYTRAGSSIFSQVRFSEREEKDGRSPAMQRIQELQELQGNPGKLDTFVDDQLAPLRAHNLDTGYEVADLLKRRIQFIASKAPKVGQPDVFTGWQAEPSKAELSEWARYIEAAEKGPVQLLEELESGDLAPETVEAVKELYPGLFAKVQELIIERVIDAKKPIRYEDRVNLTQLFDVPVEPTQAPETVHAIQDMYAMQAQQEEAAQPRGTPKPPSMTKGQQFAS